VPLADMDGQPCTVLADALGLTHAGEKHASAHYHLSLVADGWAAPRAEFRISWAQLFAPTTPDVLLRTYDSDHAVGFDITHGLGRTIVFTADLPTDLDLFRSAFARLGAIPALAHNYPRQGIMVTSTKTPTGERFIHLLNFDGFDKPVRLTENGNELLPGRTLTLRRRDALMLPFGVRIGDVTIVDSTAEIARVEPSAIQFRVTQECETVTLETERSITADDGIEVVQQENRWTVTARKAVIEGQRDNTYLSINIS
jgi:beta-galactosidase